MTITSSEIKKYTHYTETSRFILSFIITIPMVIIFVIITANFFLPVFIYILLIFLTIYIFTQVLIAQFTGNLVKISEKNFPEIAYIIEQKKKYFGYEKKIDAFIIDAEGYNAYIVSLLQRKIIIIEASMLKKVESRAEIEWIVGRFIGALTARHYRLDIFEAVINSLESAFIFNLFLLPYERAVQYTGDQLGLVAMDNNIVKLNNNIDVAARSLCKMMSGPDVGDMVSYSGIVNQSKQMDDGFFEWLARCLSPFPPTVKRFENIVMFSKRNWPAKTQEFIANNGLAI